MQTVIQNKRIRKWRHIHVAAVSLCLLLACSGPLCALTLNEEDKQLFKQSQSHQASGDYKAALTILRQLMTKYPASSDLALLAAYNAFELKDEALARHMALAALKLGRFDKDIFQHLIQIDQLRNDDLAVLNDLRLLIVTDPDNLSWRAMYADLRFNNQQVQEARSIYEALAKKDAANAKWWQRLGQCDQQLGQHKQAALHFATSWELGRRDAQTAKTLASLYHAMGDDVATSQWLKQYHTLRKSVSPQEILHFANVEQSIGNDAHAQQLARIVSEELESATKKEKAQALIMLGQYAHKDLKHKEDQKVEKVISYWEKALSLNALSHDHTEELLHALASLHFNEKRYAQAAIYFNKYLALNPASEEITLQLIRTYLANGQADKSEQALVKYIARFGMDEEAKDLLAKLTR